jgi:hypothetical protein
MGTKIVKRETILQPQIFVSSCYTNDWNSEKIECLATQKIMILQKKLRIKMMLMA